MTGNFLSAEFMKIRGFCPICLKDSVTKIVLTLGSKICKTKPKLVDAMWFLLQKELTLRFCCSNPVDMFICGPILLTLMVIISTSIHINILYYTVCTQMI